VKEMGTTSVDTETMEIHESTNPDVNVANEYVDFSPLGESVSGAPNGSGSQASEGVGMGGFEREATAEPGDDTEDIDKILSGLEEKL
jgi:hypothetical protein